MKVPNASLQWLQSGLPASARFGDIYHSQDDELGESRYVFLRANRLAERWQQQADNGQPFVIAEIGFGCALNFLQTWQLWQQSSLRPQRLHYLAFEKYPIRREELAKIQARWPDLASLSKELLRQYPDHSAGCHRLLLGRNIILDIHYGDAKSSLLKLPKISPGTIDAWFLDGFSPGLNPELWQESLIKVMADSSAPACTLSSYSVAGKVRKALGDAGFTVEKQDGFGRKRHMLFAQLNSNSISPGTPGSNGTQESEQREQSKEIGKLKEPWFKLPNHCFGQPGSAIIIGAGLAGCSTAYSLALRGWKVAIYEKNNHIAAEASGINPLALRCRLFNSDTPESRFFLHSFLFAHRQFSSFAIHGNLEWQNCGVIQLGDALHKNSKLNIEKLSSLYDERVIRSLQEGEMEQTLELLTNTNGMYLPLGGWLNPASLCRHYIDHPNIDCRLGQSITSIQRNDHHWSVSDKQGQELGVAEVLVIANSHSASQFMQTSNLVLDKVSGQVTEVASTTSSAKLQQVISGERSIFPAKAGKHLIAASYHNVLDNSKHGNFPEDNQENLAGASTLFKDDAILGKKVLGEQSAIRSNTPDRAPLVGMLPDIDAMSDTYSKLTSNARASFDETGKYLPGLYITAGHGSNGLATCPFSAEYLASLVTGENPAISQQSMDQLNPARFLIRALKKQRT